MHEKPQPSEVSKMKHVTSHLRQHHSSGYSLVLQDPEIKWLVLCIASTVMAAASDDLEITVPSTSVELLDSAVAQMSFATRVDPIS